MATELDPVKLQLMAEQLERVTGNLDRLATQLDDVADRAEKGAKGISKAFKDALDPKDAEKAMKMMVDTTKSSWQNFITQTKAGIAEMAKLSSEAYGTAADKVKKTDNMVNDMMRSVGGLEGMPFGGIIGLMMFGKWKEQEFAARGHAIAQQFENVGSVGRKTGAQIGQYARSLGVSLGRDVTGELAQVVSGFSAAGVGAEAWQQQADFAVRGVRNNLVGITHGLDMMFEAAAGTSAKQASQMFINTNSTLKDMVTLTRDIGLAAKEVGMNFQSLSGSIVQATSALRMQQVDARELADTFVTIQQGFQGQGMSRQRAGMMAEAGLGGIAQGLKGMSLGLMGYLGEQISGGRYTGPQASVMFQRGMRGDTAQGEFFGKSIEELLRITAEMAEGDELKQDFALQQLGFSQEAAQAMLEIQKNGAKSGSIAEEAAKNQGRLAKAMSDEALKTNTFTQEIAKIRDAMAQIGASLVTILMNGFDMIGMGIAYLVAWARDEEDDPAFLQAFNKSMGLSMASTNAAFESIKSNFKVGGEAAEKILGTFTGSGGGSLGLFGLLGAEKKGPEPVEDVANRVAKKLTFEGAENELRGEHFFNLRKAAMDAFKRQKVGSTQVEGGELFPTGVSAPAISDEEALRRTAQILRERGYNVYAEGEDMGDAMLSVKIGFERKPKSAPQGEGVK